MSQDVCGLSGSNYFETYGDAELFLALMGAGVTRALYVLTARDKRGDALLFDIRIEADLDSLIAGARRAGASADSQLMSLAFGHARRLLDESAYQPPAHFHLRIGSQIKDT